ncbi:MAG: hypothetical protein K2H43_06205, partial [Clostridia bacterium]|nr:hypothetical protein [Clostridia bacterium]
MKEENGTENPEEQPAGSEAAAEQPQPDLGKFKNVDALARAYKELEAEFTRRSQKLKALENASEPQGQTDAEARMPRGDEELYREVTENAG